MSGAHCSHFPDCMEFSEAPMAPKCSKSDCPGRGPSLGRIISWGNQTERLLVAAVEYIAATLEQPTDARAWDHLLIYCPREAIEKRLEKLNSVSEASS